MALPILSKTWEFAVNRVLITSTDTLTANRQLLLAVKNILTDTVGQIYNSGNIQLVSGSTYRINPGTTVFHPNTIGNVVGNTIRIRGMTTSANNGDYTVTAQTDSGGGVYILEYVNASASAEAIVGSVNVLGGNFSYPWTLNHSNSTSTIGAQDDEVDRIPTEADFVIGTGSIGSCTLKNTVTGTYWCISGDTTGSSTNATLRAATAPNILEPAVSTSVPPSSPLVSYPGTADSVAYHEFNAASLTWFINVTVLRAVLHLMISNDGECTRLLICKDGVCPAIWFDEVVKAPHPQWATGETPVVTTMQGAGSIVDRPLYTIFNDNALVVTSTIPSPDPLNYSSHPRATCYLTAEGIISAANGQYLTGKNQLADEWELYPIGLALVSTGYNARVGQLYDMWFTGTDTITGHTFPNNTNRQFIVMGDMVFPWNGSIPLTY